MSDAFGEPLVERRNTDPHACSVFLREISPFLIIVDTSPPTQHTMTTLSQVSFGNSLLQISNDFQARKLNTNYHLLLMPLPTQIAGHGSEG